jgi:hypothetical protein
VICATQFAAVSQIAAPEAAEAGRKAFAARQFQGRQRGAHMTSGNVSLQNLWASQLGALTPSSTLSSTPSSGIDSAAGGALFANLIASLRGQPAASLMSSMPGTGLLGAAASTSSAAANGPASAGAMSTSGSAGSAQIAHDLEAFLKSLQQALALAQSSGVAASLPSNATAMVHHGHQAHGHGGHHGDLNALLQDAATGASIIGSSSSSGSSTLAGLNSAFNQLMADLGATPSAKSSGQLVNTAV